VAAQSAAPLPPNVTRWMGMQIGDGIQVRVHIRDRKKRSP